MSFRHLVPNVTKNESTLAVPIIWYYCTFGFRETIFLGIIEFYPGYGGFVTFEGELVPKLVSELVSDD